MEHHIKNLYQKFHFLKVLGNTIYIYSIYIQNETPTLKNNLIILERSIL